AHRRRGYGAAITTAASRAALAAGAATVVLYTDLANPTSNALYHRLGFRPVQDRGLLELTAGGDVTGGGPAPAQRAMQWQHGGAPPRWAGRSRRTCGGGPRGGGCEAATAGGPR